MNVRMIRESDKKSISRWLKKLKTEQQPMPYNTFVVPGVAAIGLRFIDNTYWLIDSMVTNPYASSATRHKALDSLYQAIFKCIEAKGIFGLIGFTVHADALERAKRHGFKVLPHTVLMRMQ